MADVELLPLPEVVRYAACGDIAYPIYEDAEGQYVDYDDHVSAMRDYALANLAPLQAEVEALRAEVAEWKRVAAAQAELHGEAEARAERLAEVLRWISGDDTAKGCDDGMQEVEALKQRALAALAQEDRNG